MNHARSTVCGSTADGMGAGESGELSGEGKATGKTACGLVASATSEATVTLAKDLALLQWGFAGPLKVAFHPIWPSIAHMSDA